VIKNISIIGLGLIGGSIAKALKLANHSYHISAYDKPEILEIAFSEKVIDDKLKDYEQSLNSDLILLCLHVEESLKIFEKLIPQLKEKQIISDVCGVKSVFQEKWNKSNSKGIYIGGHPMTGKESSGYKNSDPALFENSVYILSETNYDTTSLEEFLSLIKLLGARIKFLNPKVHDIVVASVSHLPQLVAVSLINSASLKENEINFLDFAAGGFRDMTRIASSDFEIWGSIFEQNNKNIVFAIDNFINDLQNLKVLISNRKSILVSEKFEDARKRRDEIPKNTKGFINTLYDVFVYVNDEPGVLAKLTAKLFESGINIKDIELLKVREGTGGTFRIAFENEETALKAKNILSDSGFRIS
jgi:prephenate dehydrogenase